MPIFEYTGTDRAGTPVKSRIDADSIKTAKQKVKKTGIVLLSIEEKSSAKASTLTKLFPTLSGSGSVNLRTLAVTTRQFASLIKANIPLVEALAALIDQTENIKLKTTLAQGLPVIVWIDPSKLRLLCVKAKNHIRAGILPYVKTMIDCDAPFEPIGYIGCAASPSSVMRPWLQRGSGSRSTIGNS